MVLTGSELLSNDSASLRWIESVSNATNATAVLEEGAVRFIAPPAASGQSQGGFDYVASDGEQSAGTHVTVDYIRTTGGANVLQIGTLAGEFSSIDGLGGNDRLTGGEGRDLFLGNQGADVLEGGAGDDRLEGGSGDDILRGGDGNDVLAGGPGEDWLSGGAGIDCADYSGAGGRVFVHLGLTGQYTGAGGWDTLIGIESIVGSGAFDLLSGSRGANTIEGGGGGDQISGFAGNDLLFGNDGSDRLSGGDGADRLIGGAGGDFLGGGAGRDTFGFLAASDSGKGGFDTITDFTPGQDRISLEGVAADAGVALTFIGKSQFSGEAGEIRYVQFSREEIVVQADLDGNGAVDFRIALYGRFDIGEADFVL